MAMAYICSPYRARTERETIKNIQYACESAELVYKCGFLPIVPHLLVSIMTEDRDEALRIGKEYLSHSDALVICGSQITDGMREEIEFAHRHGMPVFQLIDGGLRGVDEEKIRQILKEVGFKPIQEGG